MKISTLILTILVCFSTIVDAQGTQNRANELMKQAQSSLEQKEYTKARYLFIQAYGAFATQENYPKAVECGTKTAETILPATFPNHQRETADVHRT